jgi:hypothetical protein
MKKGEVNSGKDAEEGTLPGNGRNLALKNNTINAEDAL